VDPLPEQEIKHETPTQGNVWSEGGEISNWGEEDRVEGKLGNVRGKLLRILGGKIPDFRERIYRRSKKRQISWGERYMLGGKSFRGGRRKRSRRKREELNWRKVSQRPSMPEKRVGGTPWESRHVTGGGGIAEKYDPNENKGGAPGVDSGWEVFAGAGPIITGKSIQR